MKRLIARLRRFLYELAWPHYDCELCVGQDPWHGCWCSYHGAPVPGEPPEWWRFQLQRLIKR